MTHSNKLRRTVTSSTFIALENFGIRPYLGFFFVDLVVDGHTEAFWLSSPCFSRLTTTVDPSSNLGDGRVVIIVDIAKVEMIFLVLYRLSPEFVFHYHLPLEK